MLIYLFKASCCLAIFILFYKALLEGQNMHHMKRAILLLALIISAIIPAITITLYVDKLPTELAPANIIWDEYVVLENGIELLPTLLWSVYGIGFMFFSYRFFRNIKTLHSQINKSEQHSFGNYKLALLDTPCIPHSFFNYLFLNKEQFESGQIPKSVIDHEIAHASQKHSIDVLTVEILHCIMWFNPLIHFLKNDIRLNHEFLADEAVVKMGHSKKEYQKTLLGFSCTSNSNPLIHSIQYQPLKKRFKIMKKQSSFSSKLIRLLSIIPLVAALTLGFSSKAIAQKNTNGEKTEQGATTKMIKEYNKIAGYFNGKSDRPKKVSSSDIKRLKELYSKMNKEQRANAEPFPDFPPAPPAPPVMKESKETIPPPPPPVKLEDLDQAKIDYFLDGEKITTEEAVKFSKTQVPLIMKVKRLESENKEGKTMEIHLSKDAKDEVKQSRANILEQESVEVRKSLYYMEKEEISKKKAEELSKEQTPSVSKFVAPNPEGSGRILYTLYLYSKV